MDMHGKNSSFSESKSVQLYEVSFINSWFLCLNPVKRLLL
ncbi:hypothetical protein F383_16748 [Gossypium arboreum]|uniref:Uncharacterized protein n=1 Tax=Gossypium arboreum TaxID=29729 RepID=A0A0B0NRS2_GOSAR|nr:hypothetical protein F383_16748 [Gossypium arboreum]